MHQHPIHYARRAVRIAGQVALCVVFVASFVALFAPEAIIALFSGASQ